MVVNAPNPMLIKNLAGSFWAVFALSFMDICNLVIRLVTVVMVSFVRPLCSMLYSTSNPTLVVHSLLLLSLILDFEDFCLSCLFIFQNSPLCRGPFPPRVGPVLSQIQRAQILNSQVDVSLLLSRSITLSKTTPGED